MQDHPSNELIEMAHRSIDRYLSGKMSADETEIFWVFLLENPEFLDHLHLDANLRHLAANEPEKFKALMAQAEAEIEAEDRVAADPYPYPDPALHHTSEDAPTTYRAQSDTSRTPAPIKKHNSVIRPYFSWIIAAAAVLLLVWGVNLMRMSSMVGAEGRLALIERLDIPASADYMFFEPLDSFRNDAAADPIERIIDMSLMLAFSGSYEEALERYEEVIEYYPDDPRVAVIFLNKGLTLFNLERWDEAISSFERAVSFDETNPHILERAYWFMANAYIHQGKLFRALRPLRLVAELPGQFGNDAWEYLSLMRPHLLDEYIHHIGGDFDFETFEGYEFLEDVDLD